ncbi:MAG: DUF2267 domain-containing protein [Deltaproteobacteria bacterium]|nr:DUF2267 domain-containing protein [Deltaproteobacteria bacterium]
MVEYKRFLQDVKVLDFITTSDEADAVVKAVLGILASSMEEPEARKFTGNLPQPLTYERLRGMQTKTIAPSLDQIVSEIGNQFRLENDQAKRLVDTVFHTTRTVIGENVLTEVESDLPTDVAKELENA